MRFSEHYREYRSELPDRERITLPMCEQSVADAIRSEVQKDGRTAYWSYVAGEDRYLKVVVESDGEVIVTAYFDRGFKRRFERRSGA